MHFASKKTKRPGVTQFRAVHVAYRDKDGKTEKIKQETKIMEGVQQRSDRLTGKENDGAGFGRANTIDEPIYGEGIVGQGHVDLRIYLGLDGVRYDSGSENRGSHRAYSQTALQ